MKTHPTHQDDLEEAEILKAQDWQLNLLKHNPHYTSWGCFEDAMGSDKGQWTSHIIIDTWKKFKADWELDDYNELVNLYFQIYRKNHDCPHCKGTNLNAATKQLQDDWYDFSNSGRKWCYSLTEIEVEALVKGGRLIDVIGEWVRFEEESQKWFKMDRSTEERNWVEIEAPVMPTPEQVNTWASGPGFGHDAINSWIALKARAKHLGVFGHCEQCIQGRIYDSEEAEVALQLWILHPRKGCSRGVYIEHVDQVDLPEVYLFLREAADRNAERFSKLP